MRMHGITSAVAMLLASASASYAEEVTLRAISAFPPNLEFTRQFGKFIDRVNETGDGVVQVLFVGGPEVIPPQQQDTAIRNGVFDMQMGPASYYNGTVPEADALFGATASPVEARDTGGIALINDIWRAKLGAEFISWQSGGIPFYVYLVDAPAMDADGILDLGGLQMRSTPAYREWFDRLGGSNVMLQTAEIFTGLERGVVSGLGWPAISFTDIGVHEFLGYRVAPPVWQLDLAIIMNAAKWDSLSDEAKAVLTEAAIAHEKATEADFAEIRAAEDAILAEAGIETVEVANPDLHRRVAHDLAWDRLAARDSTNVEALKAKLYDE